MNFIRYIGELLLALAMFATDTPVCLSQGHGYVCAPIKITYRCMTPLEGRAGWWDRHVNGPHGEPCTNVVVLNDTSRTGE